MPPFMQPTLARAFQDITASMERACEQPTDSEAHFVEVSAKAIIIIADAAGEISFKQMQQPTNKEWKQLIGEKVPLRMGSVLVKAYNAENGRCLHSAVATLLQLVLCHNEAATLNCSAADSLYHGAITPGSDSLQVKIKQQLEQSGLPALLPQILESLTGQIKALAQQAEQTTDTAQQVPTFDFGFPTDCAADLLRLYVHMFALWPLADRLQVAGHATAAAVQLSAALMGLCGMRCGDIPGPRLPAQAVRKLLPNFLPHIREAVSQACFILKECKASGETTTSALPGSAAVEKVNDSGTLLYVLGAVVTCIVCHDIEGTLPSNPSSGSSSAGGSSNRGSSGGGGSNSSGGSSGSSGGSGSRRPPSVLLQPTAALQQLFGCFGVDNFTALCAGRLLSYAAAAPGEIRGAVRDLSHMLLTYTQFSTLRHTAKGAQQLQGIHVDLEPALHLLLPALLLHWFGSSPPTLPGYQTSSWTAAEVCCEGILCWLELAQLPGVLQVSAMQDTWVPTVDVSGWVTEVLPLLLKLCTTTNSQLPAPADLVEALLVRSEAKAAASSSSSGSSSSSSSTGRNNCSTTNTTTDSSSSSSGGGGSRVTAASKDNSGSSSSMPCLLEASSSDSNDSAVQHNAAFLAGSRLLRCLLTNSSANEQVLRGLQTAQTAGRNSTMALLSVLRFTASTQAPALLPSQGDDVNTGSSSSSTVGTANSRATAAPAVVPLELVAPHTSQILQLFEPFVRNLASLIATAAAASAGCADTVVRGLDLWPVLDALASAVNDPAGPLTALVLTAGPDSADYKQMYSLLASMLKLSSVLTVLLPACASCLRVAVASAAAALLQESVAPGVINSLEVQHGQVAASPAASAAAAVGPTDTTAASGMQLMTASTAADSQLPALHLFGRCCAMQSAQLLSQPPEPTAAVVHTTAATTAAAAAAAAAAAKTTPAQGAQAVKHASNSASGAHSDSGRAANTQDTPGIHLSVFKVSTECMLSHLHADSLSQHLAAAGCNPQQLIQHLQELLSVLSNAEPSTDTAISAQISSAEGSTVQQQQQEQQNLFLSEVGQAFTLVPVSCICNNPRCSNTSGSSEQGLVSGRSCMCAGCLLARYCCRQCQKAHWKQHRPVCKAAAAAKAAATGQQG